MLIKNWTLKYEGFPNLECTSPCSLYSVLLEHGLIDNPYYGLNELKYTKLSEKDCIFETVFDVSSENFAKDYNYLTFYGLDTICDIYLNRVKLAHTTDMFRTYSFDVKSLLHEGANLLELRFESPIAYANKMQNKYYLWNNRDTLPGAAHLRKAIYMFGWDWAPKLPDMSIFKDVVFESYNCDKLDDISVLQNHRENSVTLTISASTKHSSSSDIFVSIDGKTEKMINGKAEITIDNPKLWYVRGYGKQPLYTLKTTLQKDGQIIDTDERRIGLRTLSVSTAVDSVGREFCFVNNGIKIFAMGANYVPEDSLLASSSDDRTRKLLDACVDANYNCIRIWGGGAFASDAFLDYCDENGIIVWQDFLTACYAFHMTKQFKEDYVAEASDNIKRLRNHACLGIFCGNNELERNIMQVTDVIGCELVKQDYIELFERILPTLCDELAPETYYWPSSPSAGGSFIDVEKVNKGDTHFYDPLQDYTKLDFRFCSEYGFQSFPAEKTVNSFCEKKDLNTYSRVMELHQKCSLGNKVIMEYISNNYLAPYTFDNLVYASQLFQASAIRYAVQCFRSRRGVCMGSLYWQLNDCAPVASWSSVDYYGRYKALHYYAKKFYAPIAFSIFLNGDNLRISLSNETLNNFTGKLKVSLLRNDATIIKEKELSVSGEKLSATDIFNEVITPEDKYSNCISVELYSEDGTLINREAALYVKPKHFEYLKPSINTEIKELGKNIYSLTVNSDVFAADVYLDFEETDVLFSDNFFDITSKEPYTVIFKSDKPAEVLKKELTVKSVYDIGISPSVK